MAIPTPSDPERPSFADLVRARVAPLASLAYQERYAIGGTEEEYVVPGDLLDDVTGLRHRVARPEVRATLSDAQAASFDRLVAYVDAHGGDALPGHTGFEELGPSLRDGPIWVELRRLAASVLREFGVEIDAMSLTEVEALVDG